MPIRLEHMNGHNVVVNDTDKATFLSYGKNIAVLNKADGAVTLDEKYWDYSPTTTRYLCAFLIEHAGAATASKPLIRDRIDKGIYKVEALEDCHND